MTAQRCTAKEQYQLIMECRSSGLSDCQWCTEHGINPGIFYNRVKRLRKKAYYKIPPATGRNKYKPFSMKDVVKLEIMSQVSACPLFRIFDCPSPDGTVAFCQPHGIYTIFAVFCILLACSS